MKNIQKPEAIIYQFDRDLRVCDNSLFTRACEAAVEQGADLLCLYSLPKWAFESFSTDQAGMGTARYQFLYESLLDLDIALQSMGLELVVKVAEIKKVVQDLNQFYSIVEVFTANRVGSFETDQLKALKVLLPDAKFTSTCNSTLFKLDELPFESDQLPKHFTPFRKKVEDLYEVKSSDVFESLTYKFKQNINTNSDLAVLTEPVSKFNSQSNSCFAGGSSAGLAHLGAYFASNAPSNYKQDRNELLGWSHSTKFSPWLALGCVSPHQIMLELSKYEAEQGANESTYWIYFELLWREFFYWNALKVGTGLFKSMHKIDARANYDGFMLWCGGETGEPLIDACMRELNHTGYLTNRGRQIAASYLIHEVGADWRLGASYFERILIDYDVASNWGNWQYIAGVGADPRGGRHFNVEKQQKTHDPQSKYIDEWSHHKMNNHDMLWTDLVA